MLLSMTGFGKATVTAAGKKITVEIKSLNSKQFDMQSRVPSAYRELELEMRRIVADRLERGKIDLTVSCESLGHDDGYAQIDTKAAASYHRQIEEMCSGLGIQPPADWATVIMRMPDILTTAPIAEISDGEKTAVLSALQSAVEALMAHRRQEGLKLEDFFALRLHNITALLEQIPQWEKERIDRVYARLEESLAQLKNIQVDRGRLEQEMIFYIEKLDVNEERQRLGQHLLYFAETMALPTPGQGKKLGFISQEMGREINTLGSKSNHAEMQKQVVKMKDELEQIKEQVLNVM